jgi:hypothetical protein
VDRLDEIVVEITRLGEGRNHVRRVAGDRDDEDVFQVVVTAEGVGDPVAIEARQTGVEEESIGGSCLAICWACMIMPPFSCYAVIPVSQKV